MERLWENGLPLWKVYGDPYRSLSHFLPAFVIVIQKSKIRPNTEQNENKNTSAIANIFGLREQI